eukprot:COSAG04_NODE_29846_length_266_cov_0.622754_2_plen_42_part_01
MCRTKYKKAHGVLPDKPAGYRDGRAAPETKGQGRWPAAKRNA